MNVFGLILDKEKTIERVFKICQFYNVKNVDLAELMYTTEVEISNWKTGKRFPDWDKIPKSPRHPTPGISQKAHA